MKVMATSAIDMFNVHADTFIRSEARNLDVLPALFCEDEVVLDKVAVSKSIDPDLLRTCRVCRAACHDFSVDETGTGIKITLARKSGFLLQTDLMFKIEMAFWDQTIGDAASGRLVDAIMECFPKDDLDRTMLETKALLVKMPSSKLATLCGMGLQALLSTVIELLDALILGTSPNLVKIRGSPVADKLPKACALFLVVEKAGGKQQGLTKLHGAAAVAWLFDELNRKVEDHKAMPTYAELVRFRQFAWLLIDSQAKQIKAFTEHALQATGSVSSHGAASSSSGADPSLAAPKKRGRKSVVKDDAATFVAKFFS